MIPQSERLKPLQQVADIREDAAMRRYAASQRVLAERETRLVELQNYLRDYLAAESALAPAMLANRHAFIQRLREAERFQQQAVEQARAAVEAERLRYLVQQRDAGVLDQLAACYRSREALVVERRTQRQMDEFASRRHFDAGRDSAA